MSIVDSEAWKLLQSHRNSFGEPSLKELFSSDPARFEKFHINFNDILLDYSKNWIDEKTMRLLAELLKTAKVSQKAKEMFEGKHINITEDRAVLHIALRNRSNKPIISDGKDVMIEVSFFILLFLLFLFF